MYVSDDCGVRSLRFEHNRQSSMYVADPFETDIDYCGCLHLTIAVQPRATRMLAIGLGGGTVVKRMWRDYPHMRIDAVELEPEIVEIARTLFALPDDPRIRVHVGDGRAFLEAGGGTWDVIVIDAFDDDRIPRPLLTEEFMRTCRDHLAPGGVVAYNVIGTVTGAHSKPFRSLMRTASNVWPRLWAFTVGRLETSPNSIYNVIVLATESDLPDDELLERIADRVGGMVTVPGFPGFGENLYRGRVRMGDVPILSDPVKGARGRR